MATNWKLERKNLGVDPDVEIARRLGVTKERVRQERKKVGIPWREATSTVRNCRRFVQCCQDRETSPHDTAFSPRPSDNY